MREYDLFDLTAVVLVATVAAAAADKHHHGEVVDAVDSRDWAVADVNRTFA